MIKNKKIIFFLAIVLIIVSFSIFQLLGYDIEMLEAAILLAIIALFIYFEIRVKSILKQNNNKFQLIFSSTSIGFLIVDEKRYIVDINPKLMSMFGYSDKEQLIGKDVRLLHLDEKHYEDFGKDVFSKAVISEVVNIEFELKRKDNTTQWCEISGTPLKVDDKSNKTGVLWAIIDINDKKDAQKKIIDQNEQLQLLNQNLSDEVANQVEKIREKDTILIQQAKMATMGEMMDAVAHQWKQPLHIVKLSTDELNYMIEDNEVNVNYLKEFNARIVKQINHMVETLDVFREFFRPKVKLQTVILKKVVDSSLVLMKDELIKHTIVTKFTGDEYLTANIIPNEFKHIIINLVNNSKDEFILKSVKNRLITFEVTHDDIYVILKVKDNAGGIPENIIDNIFKANISMKSEKDGSGIGLYLSKNIIEKIGGSIEVKNIENGAEFIIRIPI